MQRVAVEKSWRHVRAVPMNNHSFFYFFAYKSREQTQHTPAFITKLSLLQSVVFSDLSTAGNKFWQPFWNGYLCKSSFVHKTATSFLLFYSHLKGNGRNVHKIVHKSFYN